MFYTSDPPESNRSLISLKRSCAWAAEEGLLSRNPAKVVKLVPEEKPAPRHLDEKEEHRLVTAVTNSGTLRDRTIITLLLHTGLCAHELCALRRDQLHQGNRTGLLEVMGKRNNRVFGQFEECSSILRRGGLGGP